MGKIKVDFGGVDKEIKKGSGKSAHVPEGDYLLKVVSSDLKESQKGSRYISWKFQIASGKFKGKTLYGSTSLKPEALWSLRNLIHAATGKNVAGKAVSFDPENIYGKVVAGAVEDNEYKKDGKTKVTSQVSTCFPKEDLEESDEDEDDEETEEEEDDDDEEEDEDLEEVDVEDI